MNDNVNHPAHYTSSKAKCPDCGHKIECIDITRHMSFAIGNAVKYLWRFQLKNGIEDLEKAAWYLNDEISNYHKDTPSNPSFQDEYYFHNETPQELKLSLAPSEWGDNGAQHCDLTIENLEKMGFKVAKDEHGNAMVKAPAGSLIDAGTMTMISCVLLNGFKNPVFYRGKDNDEKAQELPVL